MTKQSYFDKFFLTWFGGKKSNQSQCSQQNLPEVKLNDKLFQIYKLITFEHKGKTYHYHHQFHD